MLPQRLEERRAWLRRGFAAAVQHALRHRADLLLQVGDLFDSPEPRNMERQFVAEALADLRAAGVRCFGISGNHDTPRARGGEAPATPQGAFARLGGLRLLGDGVTGGRGDGESGGAGEGESGRAREFPLPLGDTLPEAPLPEGEGRGEGSAVGAGGPAGPSERAGTAPRPYSIGQVEGGPRAAGDTWRERAAAPRPPYASQDPALRTQDSAQNSEPRTQNSTHHTVDTEILDVGGIRVAVGGMTPDPTALPGSDPLEGVVWQPDADIAILLLHGSLAGHVYPGAPEPIIRRDTVERLGVDCLIVGHVHRFATFRWGATSVVVPGATEQMTFGELESLPGFVYLELDLGKPPHIQHVPVDPQPRRQLTITSSELATDDPAEVVKAQLEAVWDREAMVRLSFAGPITRQRYHDLRLREVAEFGAARCFFLDLDTSGLYVADDLPRAAARGGRLSPREELLRFGEEVRETAATTEEQGLIDEAMQAILSEYQ